MSHDENNPDVPPDHLIEEAELALINDPDFVIEFVHEDRATLERFQRAVQDKAIKLWDLWKEEEEDRRGDEANEFRDA